MKLGLQVSRFDFPGGDAAIGPTFAALARGADQAGLASFWVMDHFFQIEMIGPATDPMLEGYSALAYAAAVTERIKLGTMVTGVTYRYPGLLAKTVATLDVLSGGRAYLGIGAAWYEQEHRALGVPYPPTAERFERLEETLQIAAQMWSGEAKPYAGKHYQLAETLCHPLPVSKPHPPILIGGGGEQKTLRLVARYADACNLFASDLAQVRHKLDVLRGHCQAEGRPYEAIEKTTLGGIPRVTRDGRDGSFTPAQAVDFLGRLAEMGIDHHLLGWQSQDDPALLDLIGAEVLPATTKLVPAGRAAVAV